MSTSKHIKQLPKLLTREQFKEFVFRRDGYKCVFCEKDALDAHHIIERRLFGKTQGYFIDNGISVCEEHHLACERTDISVEEARERAGIKNKIIPDHLYSDQIYDKWGNPVLSNGQRLKGELFFDESVQKIIKEHLLEFTKYVKYPRTYHLPWSDGINDDDRVLDSLDAFIGKRIIVTQKMDGECTTMYNDYIHARSVESKSHPTRDWVKNFHATICNDIPEGWRICGENLYAKHSIEYNNLKSYFYGFNIWNDKNICLSWDETLEWFSLLNITPVQVIFDGIFDENKIKTLYNLKKDYQTCEGYVIRVADEISYSDFKTKAGKFVRKNHVQTTKHWLHGQKIEKNFLEK